MAFTGALPDGRASAWTILPHGADEAAVLLLHLQEARHRGAQAEQLWIGCIDAADHWLRHPIERFASQPAADKVCQAFIAIGGSAWEKKIQGHARFAERTENLAGKKRPDQRRRQQVKTFGHGTQCAATDNEAATMLNVGFDQLRLEPQSLSE